jgi:hypothetical protein
MDNPTISIPSTHKHKWLFWLLWVFASEAAAQLCYGLIYAAIAIANRITPGINQDRFFGWLFFPVLAACLGLLQWLVLRTRFSRSGWWVLATMLGLLVGVALDLGLARLYTRISGESWNWDYLPGLLLLYLLIGLCLALAQLIVIQRHLTKKSMWLLLNLLGWLALGLIVGKSIDRTSDMIALGSIPAVFSGLGLLWFTQEKST